MRRIRTVDVVTDLESALEDYLFYKQSQGRREATIQDIEQKVKQFFRAYPDAWPLGVKKAAQDWLGQEGIQPATYNLRLSALNGFFQWALEEEHLAENPLAGYKSQRKEPRIVDIPDSALEGLMDCPNVKTFAGLRDLAIIILTLDTGIRPQETRRLHLEHVNLTAGRVDITQEVSKTHMSRTLYMSSETVRALREWIQVRSKAFPDDAPLFTNEFGLTLTKDAWGDRMERYSRALGTKIRPYDLRHAFAIRYLRNGGNCFMLQRLMGHSRPEQTTKYLAFVNNDLEEDHKKASPIKKLTIGKYRAKRIVRTA